MSSISLNLEDFFNLPTAVIYNPDGFRTVTSVTIDSRNVRKHSAFIAIKGENFDGHSFVKNAVRSGSKVIVINEKKYRKYDNVRATIITVKDTTKALGDLANIWRKKTNTKIIGITGSSGKTTTKEMLATILREKYKVNKTKANYNNHIGVPLTILDTSAKNNFLVLELGTNHFGEIEYLSKVSEPDYAIITNIGNSHLEFLKNKRGVLKEKSALFRITDENDGLVFINNDDALLKNSAKKFSKKITYGFCKGSTIKGRSLGLTKDGSEIINIKKGNRNYKISLSFYGEHNKNNFLSAAAVAIELGITKSQLQNGINKYKPAGKRFNIKKIKNSILIDDTYNANPDSTSIAIKTMSDFWKDKNKIVVFGDMLELGKDSIKLHQKLSSVLVKEKVNELITVGKYTKHLNKKLEGSKILTKHFSKKENMIKYLEEKDFDNSIVLVKGSRGMKMEQYFKIIEEGLI